MEVRIVYPTRVDTNEWLCTSDYGVHFINVPLIPDEHSQDGGDTVFCEGHHLVNYGLLSQRKLSGSRWVSSIVRDTDVNVHTGLVRIMSDGRTAVTSADQTRPGELDWPI